jgi:hypothetical protein
MAKRKVGGKVKGAAKPKGVVKSQGLFSRLPKRAYKPTGVVHLKHEFADALDGEPDNTYWAIGGSQYETQRVAGSGADWASRINRSDRKDRGLLDYKNCKDGGGTGVGGCAAGCEGEAQGEQADRAGWGWLRCCSSGGFCCAWVRV